MKTKHKKLLIDFLEEYSERLGNDGCNDWNFPDDWTEEDIKEFVNMFAFANRPNDPNGDGENYSNWAESKYMPNDCAVAVLQYILKKELDSSAK